MSAASARGPTAPRDLVVAAPDGLRLRARDWSPPITAGAREPLPVICLPGLTRTSADFSDLAVALSGDASRPRRVLAIDFRGRGGSERDPDPDRYDVRVEAEDVLAVATAAGIGRALVVGTSRGGLVAMLLAAMRPALLAGIVLNDIGPEIAVKGLLRLRGTVGKLPRPRDYGEGGSLLARLMDAQFPRLTPADWEAMARATWREAAPGEDGPLVPDYDPALSRTLASVDASAPPPNLWPLFAGLAETPLLVLRGALSDILTAETLAAMAREHPHLQSVTVPDEGHAPLLRGALAARIAAFAAEVEVG